jgi:hypothetical protein
MKRNCDSISHSTPGVDGDDREALQLALKFREDLMKYQGQWRRILSAAQGKTSSKKTSMDATCCSRSLVLEASSSSSSSSSSFPVSYLTETIIKKVDHISVSSNYKHKSSHQSQSSQEVVTNVHKFGGDPVSEQLQKFSYFIQEREVCEIWNM